MTNGELTMLAYLADALASKPKAFAPLLEQARNGVSSPTAEFAAVIEELQQAFQQKSPGTPKEVDGLADVLIESTKTARARAGQVLKWGLVERTDPGIAI